MSKRLIYSITLLLLLLTAPAFAAPLLDETPRIAVISAYEPEWTLLKEMIQQRKDYVKNGTTFITGTIENKPVVLFLCGVSMVNAAMTTQLALDNFPIKRMVFSGTAGGVNPHLSMGDVVVPQEWEEYLEMIFARKTNNGYTLPNYTKGDLPIEHFGMMYPQPVYTVKKDHPDIKKLYWFSVDSQMLSIAKNLAAIKLKKCTSQDQCLKRQPQLIVGGNGVSGQVFNDNKDFREYTFKTFNAEALDMETAAVAHVAYVNDIPFIAFRGLSDLAGGGPDANEEDAFEQLASDNAALAVQAFLKALPV